MRSTRYLIVAVAPTARVSHLGPAALTVLLAALPAVVIRAMGGDDVGPAIVLLGLAAGAAMGWATDDPAAELLAPCPISSPMRAALRCGVVAASVALCAAECGAVIAFGGGLPNRLGDRIPETAAAATAALAVGFAGVRAGGREVGPSAVLAGLLLPAAVAAFAFRWSAGLPSFTPSATHWRWWMVAALGAVIAIVNLHERNR